MLENAVAGQDLAVGLLLADLTRGRVGQTYLFHGPSGTGKTAAAMAFAMDLLCLFPEKGQACGRCPSCHAVAEGSHPDLTVVKPEGQSFKIDQVREVVRQVSLRPAMGPRKVFVLDEADKLTADAANALLKSLEDPPPGTIFVLTSGNRETLPPTVLSRCLQIPFRPVATSAVAALLQKEAGLEEAAAQYCAVLSGGSPGRALALAQDLEIGALRAKAEELAGRAPGFSAAEAIGACDELEKLYGKDRQRLEAFLDMMEYAVAGRLRQAADGREPIQSWLSSLSRFEKAKSGLRRNVAVRLCLDFLFLGLSGQRQ